MKSLAANCVHPGLDLGQWRNSGMCHDHCLWLWILWNADTDQVSLKFSLSIPSALKTAVTRTILKQIQLFDFRSTYVSLGLS